MAELGGMSVLGVATGISPKSVKYLLLVTSAIVRRGLGLGFQLPVTRFCSAWPVAGGGTAAVHPFCCDLYMIFMWLLSLSKNTYSLGIDFRKFSDL